MTAIEKILSGEWELCVPIDDGNWEKAFLRNASFKVDGTWTKTETIPVEPGIAKEISEHICVVKSQQALTHYATRQFPKSR